MADNPFRTNPDGNAPAPEPDYGPMPDLTALASTTSTSIIGTIGTFFKTLVLYIPNALVLFGFILDIINQELRYSIASFIGISSVFVNFLFGTLAKKLLSGKSIGEAVAATAAAAPAAAAAVVEPAVNPFRDAPGNPFAGGMRGGYIGCTVPGFESIESLYAPQGLVLPAAIFMYLIMDFGTHRSASQNIGLGVILPAILVMHSAVMWGLGCFEKYYWKSPFITIFAGFAVGALCGITGWGIVRSVAPDKLPTAAGGVAPSPPGSPPNLGPGGTSPVGLGSTRTPGVGSCSAPNDQDQFVCEAYKNGKLITTTIAE
jgi:hypothetical protein